jgi:hypothetical protein
LRRFAIAIKGSARLGWAVLAAAAIMAASGAANARAGTWIQVACVNPNGSAAPSEGWTTGSSGGGAPIASVQCGPGTPMSAELSSLAPAPAGAEAHLIYQPPAGSTLEGGTVTTTLEASGTGPSLNSSGYAGLYEPDFSSSFYQCATVYPCNGSADTFSGALALPSDRGGYLGVKAGCTSGNGTACNLNPQGGTYARAEIASAQLLLSNAVSPTGSGFQGSALQGRVRGTGHVVFTAAEPSGPGIYQVTVGLDGHAVFAATPNSNGGTCVPVGSGPGGALMFDYQQPCLTSEVVDVPVPTTGFPDGTHELTITVADAAGNTSTVLDQTITTSNPQTTPNPRGRGAIHARFVISWRWRGASTTLRSITVDHLPRAAGITVTCTGRRCPTLRIHHENAPRVGPLLRSLTGLRFHARQTLHISVTERHHHAEHIQLTFRNGHQPQARLVR